MYWPVSSRVRTRGPGAIARISPEGALETAYGSPFTLWPSAPGASGPPPAIVRRVVAAREAGSACDFSGRQQGISGRIRGG